jgi:hypothetical protein
MGIVLTFEGGKCQSHENAKLTAGGIYDLRANGRFDAGCVDARCAAAVGMANGKK